MQKQSSTPIKVKDSETSAAHFKIFQALRNLYPDAASELLFKNDFQLVVAVILSAQCTDKKVNQVTPELFERYEDFQALSKARVESLEKIVKPINYYRTKAKHLIEMASQVVTEFNNALPRSHDELISLSGVGRKTANVILSEIGAAHAIAVDTHVFRVSRRLEIASGSNVLQVEKSLESNFPPQDWRTLHHVLILHGRRVCKAQRPLCEICPLSSLCPFFKKNVKK